MKKAIIVLCLLFIATGCGGDKKAKEETSVDVAEQENKNEDKDNVDENKEIDETEAKEEIKMVPVELDNVTVMCPEEHELVDKSGVYFAEEIYKNNYVGISFLGVYVEGVTDFESLKQIQKDEVTDEYGPADFDETEMGGHKVALAFYKEKVGENDIGVWEHMVYLGDKATSKCNVYMIGVIVGQNPLDGYKLETVEEMIKTAVPKE